MAFLEKLKTIDGDEQMLAEFIDHLFSVPASQWTGAMDTKAKTPLDWWSAWKQMVGVDMNLHAANYCFKLQHYSEEHILVAQQHCRQGHRLVVLTHKPYRIIDVRPGNVDRASVVIWEDA